MHPVAQRLAVHCTGLCCRLPRPAVQHQGDRRHSTRRLRVVRAGRSFTQLARRSVQTGNRYCHCRSSILRWRPNHAAPIHVRVNGPSGIITQQIPHETESGPKPASGPLRIPAPQSGAPSARAAAVSLRSRTKPRRSGCGWARSRFPPTAPKGIKLARRGRPSLEDETEGINNVWLFEPRAADRQPGT